MAVKSKYERCPECHKRYRRDPNIKHIRCPYCGGIGAEIPGKPIFDAVRVEDVRPDKFGRKSRA